MEAVIGNGIALLALAVIVGLAVRSLWRSRRSGGGCNGDCGSCGGCRRGGGEPWEAAPRRKKSTGDDVFTISRACTQAVSINSLNTGRLRWIIS